MKLSQLTESFVISNDEFEDYLNRTTEQLAQELQSGKNARDAIHDLALQFAAQHNKAYEAYVRMSDALTARMHTLELDAPAAPAAPEMGMEPEMGDDMGGEPEMMTDPMGDMEMDTPADDEMPSDSDMDDYAAVMDNEPEEVEESINEAGANSTEWTSFVSVTTPAMKQWGFDVRPLQNGGLSYVRDSRDEGDYYIIVISPKDNKVEYKFKTTEGGENDTHEVGFVKMDTNGAEELLQMADDGYFLSELGESVVEGEERPYVCVHAKKGKHECRASTSYEAAQKAAKAWGLKSTSGIDAHLAVDEGVKDVVKGAGKKIKKAGKKVAKFFGHDEHPAFGEFEDGEFDESAQWCGICGNDTCTCPPDAVSESMEVINKIVADKQAGKLHGMTVDMFTASAIKQIYDAVGDENKAKLDGLMTSKEGVLKAANIAMKMMKEGKMNEFAPIAGMAARAIGGAVARRAGAAGAANMIGKAANAAGTASNIANKVGAVGGAVKGAAKLAKGVVGAVAGQYKRAAGMESAESKADNIMRTSTRASFSEYNEFYKELDKAAKAGKKAGDTISVGGKNIKLKSNPKQMHQLTDSDMNAIDALAEKCKSHRK